MFASRSSFWKSGRASSGVGRRPAEGRQGVGRDGVIALERHAPGHVLGVGIEAPVLVDDDDAGELLGALRLGRVGPHLSRLARILDVARLETRVVFRDDLAAGPAALQGGQERRRGGRPARDRGQPAQEFATVHPAARVRAVEVLDLRAHGDASLFDDCFPRMPPSYSAAPDLSRPGSLGTRTRGHVPDRHWRPGPDLGILET